MKRLLISGFFLLALVPSACSGSYSEYRTISLQERKALAEQGDAESQYNLGNIYLSGTYDNQRDVDKAKKWFRLATAQGHVLAKEELERLEQRILRGFSPYTNVEKYEGEYKIVLPHGKGTQTFLHGDVYIGEFKNGLRDGQGTLRYIKSGIYIG
jgi:TPR repeat protein